MQFIALAACFFLLCYGHGHRHHHVVRHHAPVVHRYHSVKPAPEVVAPDAVAPGPATAASPKLVDPILRPTGSCEVIREAYDDFFYTALNGFGSEKNRDRFVARYPANEQRKVLICLEQTGRGN
jgi:hypothetical protein